MKRLLTKFTGVFLALAMTVTLLPTAKAAPVADTQVYSSGISINGDYLTPEEFTALLDDGYVLTVVSGTENVQQGRAAVAIAPAALLYVGVVLIATYGTVSYYYGNITVNQRPVPRGTPMYNNLIQWLNNNVLQASKKPSGKKRDDPTSDSVSEIERKLYRQGFREKKNGNGGGHQKWVSPDGKRTVTVPHPRGGKITKRKTLESIWKQTGWW